MTDLFLISLIGLAIVLYLGAVFDAPKRKK